VGFLLRHHWSCLWLGSGRRLQNHTMKQNRGGGCLLREEQGPADQRGRPGWVTLGQDPNSICVLWAGCNEGGAAAQRGGLGGGAKGVKRVGVNECGGPGHGTKGVMHVGVDERCGPGCDSKGRAHADIDG
jgi:hypothetical protein